MSNIDRTLSIPTLARPLRHCADKFPFTPGPGSVPTWVDLLIRLSKVELRLGEYLGIVDEPR